MSAFDPETFEMKYKIADIATNQYVEGDGHFTIKGIAGELNIDPAEIFNYFPNKEAILEFYYASLVVRYEMMIEEIDDFQSYTLEEKLSNFAFTTFDMLSEKEAFVKATFKELVLSNYTKTEYEKQVEELIKRFLNEDQQLSVSSTVVLNSYFFAFLRLQFLELIRFWLHDDSEGREMTMELVDKLTSLLQELMYNAIIDKWVELAKFIYANRKKFLGRIPVIKELFSKIEIR